MRTAPPFIMLGGRNVYYLRFVKHRSYSTIAYKLIPFRSDAKNSARDPSLCGCVKVQASIDAINEAWLLSPRITRAISITERSRKGVVVLYPIIYVDNAEALLVVTHYDIGNTCINDLLFAHHTRGGVGHEIFI